MFSCNNNSRDHVPIPNLPAAASVPTPLFMCSVLQKSHAVTLTGWNVTIWFRFVLLARLRKWKIFWRRPSNMQCQISISNNCYFHWIMVKEKQTRIVISSFCHESVRSSRNIFGERFLKSIGRKKNENPFDSAHVKLTRKSNPN